MLRKATLHFTPVLLVVATALFAQQPPPPKPPPKPQPKRPIDIRIIGFAVNKEADKQLRDMAAAGKGRYYPADNEYELLKTLGEIVGVQLTETLNAEREPNNTLGKANTIAPSGQVRGTINPKRDVDCYLLEVDEPGRLDVSVTNVPANLSVQARAHNAENHGISGLFRPQRPGAETTGQVNIPRRGKYYLYVSDVKGEASNQPYTLNLQFHKGDAHELNNTFGTAKVIQPNAKLFANILPLKDADWFTFKVPKRGSVNVSITKVAPELDLEFRVHNADNHGVGGAVRPMRAGADTVGVVDLPAAGRYCLRVHDIGGNACSPQNYELALAYSPGDQHEPNERMGVATEITPTTQLTASILPKGDQDWFTFEVDHRGALDVRIDNAPDNLELQFRVFNREMYSVIGDINPLRAGAENHAVVDLPLSGRYYLRINDVRNDQRNAQPYTLQLTYHRADAHEGNNTFGTAKPLSGQAQGTILPKGDVDWYVFEVDKPGMYEVSVTNVAKELDIHARVSNAENYGISGYLKPLRAGAETRGKVKIPAAGKYYVQLIDGGGDARSTQPYTVKIAPAAKP